MAGAQPPGCVFVPDGPDVDDPSRGGPGDTRRFRVGEPICLRGIYNPRMGTYVRPHPIPGDPRNRVFTHVVHVPEYPGIDRSIVFTELGKIVPTLGPQLSVEQVGRAFPEIDPDSVSRIGEGVGILDPGRFARHDYANARPPHGVSARRPNTGGPMSGRVRKYPGPPQGGRRTRRRRRQSRTKRFIV